MGEGRPSSTKVGVPTYMRSLSPWFALPQQQQSRLFPSQISTPSMGGSSKDEVPPIVKYLDSALTINVDTHEVVSPTLPTSHSSDPTLLGPRTPSPGRGSAGGCADKGEINASPRTLPLIHFVLGNFFFAMSLISLIIFIVFFAVTWFTIFQDARLMRDQVPSNTNGVSILGHSLQLDLDECTLSISWKVAVCGVRTASGAPFWDDIHVPTNCKPFDKALDVYINDPSKPILSFIPYAELVNQRLSVWDPPRLITEHQFDKYTKWDPTENLMVPFEHYTFHVFAFAIDPTTNRSIDIATFGVIGTLGDFVIRSHDEADMAKFTYEFGDGLVTMEVKSHALRVEIKQSVIARAFAICLFLGNWAMTIGSVYITALVSSGKLEANSIVAALPFSALLAIPTIRSLCFGSLSLGISIGAAAFFMQTATTGLCCLVLLRILTRCPSSCSAGSPV